MHDPMTVAWEFKLPLLWRESWRWPRILTIWHNDPCTDGSDDSCCARKRLGRKHKGLLGCMGGDEARSPWFLRERAKQPSSPADAEALIRGALWHVATCTRLDRWAMSHRRITFADCARIASELLHNTVDNVRGSLCLLPGWHTNDCKVGEQLVEIDPNDDAAMDAERARPADDYPAEASEWARRHRSEAFFRMIARILSRETARWWQEPRWHLWHWSFQVPAWQRFKRRFSDRCSKCGVRYRGTSEVFTDWEGTRTWCAACHGATAKADG